MSSRWHISRRTMLRGLGATMALPLLDAMAMRTGLGAVASAAPLRMAAIFFPNGRWMPTWTPDETGRDFKLPPSLEPLAPVKDRLLVLSGLALDNARPKGDGGGDHARSAAAFLTGAHPFKTAGADIHAGISMDQVAAQRIGSSTRLPSLEVGLDHGELAGDCDSGYACAYVSNVSWRAPGTPTALEIDPGAVFDRLFGANTPEGAKHLKFRQSILDAVAEDSKDLSRRLGAADQRKLDEFSSSVREIEQRLQKMQSEKPLTPPADFHRPEHIPDNAADAMRLMYDLIALAFQMDLTRVSTFMTARDGSNRTYHELGLTEGHHSVSHHGDDDSKIEAVKKIDRFHMEHFAYFIQKLQSIPEGDGTLLDHSMILGGSGISDGDRHNHDELPILLAGRGNGAITPGRHIRYDDGTPLCNLYMSMLAAMGIKLDRFGDSTGPLNQLG